MADRRPDPAPDRLQAEAAFVLGPDLTGRPGGAALACATAASTPFKGRLLRGAAAAHAAAAALDDELIRRSASQPRRGRNCAKPRRRAIETPPWGRSTPDRPRAASDARTRRTAHLRSAAWRCGYSAAAGRRAPSGRGVVARRQFSTERGTKASTSATSTKVRPCASSHIVGGAAPPRHPVAPGIRFQLLEGQMLSSAP